GRGSRTRRAARREPKTPELRLGRQWQEVILSTMSWPAASTPPCVKGAPLPCGMPRRRRFLHLAGAGGLGDQHATDLGERPLMHPPFVLGLLRRPLAPRYLLHPRVAPGHLLAQLLTAHLRHQPLQPDPLAPAAW